MNSSRLVAFVLLAILALGAVVVAREFRHVMDLPSVQRKRHRDALEDMARELKNYRAGEHAWPDNLFRLFQHEGPPKYGNLGYSYHKPPAGAGDDFVVLSSDVYLRAVRQGERWSDSQVADHDIPAIVFILDAALRIEELPLDEAAKRLQKPANIEAK